MSIRRTTNEGADEYRERKQAERQEQEEREERKRLDEIAKRIRAEQGK